jgi:hypothetical protein
MGRPRKKRKDLPPGMHLRQDGAYFYRATKGDRCFVTIGKVDREAADWAMARDHRRSRCTKWDRSRDP